MSIQVFTLLDNNLNFFGEYTGICGSDSHGLYVLFSPELRYTIKVSDFARKSDGKLIHFFEQGSEVINDTRYLKLYYK